MILIPLSLTGGVESFSWTISGLGEEFNLPFYISAGVTDTYFVLPTTSISGIINEMYAASGTGGGYTVSNSNVPYSSGTYVFYGFVQNILGLYSNIGSASVTIDPYTPPNPRPNDWAWSSSWTVGSELKVSAGTYANTSEYGDSTWNGFLYRINRFRVYKYLSEYPTNTSGSLSSFKLAVTGSPMEALQFNQARNAISGMTSVSAVPTVNSSTTITKADFNAIAFALDSI